MKKILRIDSSMRAANSISRQLSDQIIQTIDSNQITVRDLRISGVPQIDEAWMQASFTAAEDRNAAQQQALALSDELIAEVRAADLLVIGVPIYNFGVPAALKAWIDQICRAGETFRYTENGPVGLLENKRAIIVITSGGTRSDSDIDFATPHMRQVMRFIGINDVKFVLADNLMTDDSRMESAEQAIPALFEWANAA